MSTLNIPSPLQNKSTGLSAVWRETTGAIAVTASTLGTLSLAGQHLAKNAEMQAAISRLESSTAALKAIGIEASGVEAVVNAQELVAYLRSI